MQGALRLEERASRFHNLRLRGINAEFHLPIEDVSQDKAGVSMGREGDSLACRYFHQDGFHTLLWTGQSMPGQFSAARPWWGLPSYASAE